MSKKGIIGIIAVCAVIVAGVFIYNGMNSTKITEHEAREIAYRDAKVTASDVTNDAVNYDRIDKQFNVEFTVNDGEDLYEYVISELDGAIITKDHVTVTEQNANTTIITENEAIDAALKDAGFAKADVSDLKSKLHSDKNEYEIKFVAIDTSDSKKYDYKYFVNASDGKVIDKEQVEHIL